MNRLVIAGSLGMAVFLAGLLISGSWTGWNAKTASSKIAAVPAETPKPDAEEWAPPAPPMAGPVPASLLPASQQPRIDRMMQFNRRTLAQTYDRVGSQSPDWDEPAHAAMEAAARFFSGAKDPPAEAKDVHVATQKALDADCDDPLILYLHVRSADPQTPDAELERGYMKAGDAMKGSAYPAFRRAAPLRKAAELKLKRKDDPKARAEALALLFAALQLIPVSAREDERCLDVEDIWYQGADDILKDLRKLGMEPPRALALVEKYLAAEKQLEATRLLLRGQYLIKSAWEARGSGYADTVTADKWRLFDQRITAARVALERSWELAPENGRAAYEMLTIERAQTRGRAAMEMWFERAMVANPTLKVCGQKLDWLHPKWHGTKEAMLVFGRQCRDSQNWERGLPLIVVQTHRLIADMLVDDAIRSNYYRRPDVAGDILYAYAGCLKLHPDDHNLRGRYAYYLYTCGRPAESHRQFQRLGQNLPWESEFFTETLMKQTRAKAAEHAGS